MSDHKAGKKVIDATPAETAPDCAESLMLLRWTLSLTPWERLKVLEEVVRQKCTHLDLVAKPDLIVEMRSS